MTGVQTCAIPIFPLVTHMLNSQASDPDHRQVGLHNLDETENLPGGWWILPAAVLGLAGWICIFYALVLL